MSTKHLDVFIRATRGSEGQDGIGAAPRSLLSSQSVEEETRLKTL